MRALIEKVISYGISKVLEKALPFLVLPILAAELSTEDFGRYLFFQTAYLLLGYLVQFATEAKYAVDKTNCTLEGKEDGSVHMSFVTITFLVLTVVLSILYGLSREWFWKYEITLLPLITMMVALYLRSIIRINLVMRQFDGDNWAYFKLQGFNGVFKSLIGLVLLFTIHSWQSMIYGLLIGNLLSVFIFRCKYVFINLSSFKNLGNLLKYGFPLVLSGVSGWLISSGTKVIVSEKLGLEVLADYGILSLIYVIIIMLGEILNSVFIPAQYRMINLFSNVRVKSLYRKARNHYFAFVILSTVLIAMFAQRTLRFIFGEYNGFEFEVIAILAFGALLNALYKWPVGVIFVKSKTSVLFWINAISGTLTLGLSVLFIDKSGVLGVVLAIALGSLLPLLVTTNIEKRLLDAGDI